MHWSAYAYRIEVRRTRCRNMQMGPCVGFSMVRCSHHTILSELASDTLGFDAQWYITTVMKLLIAVWPSRTDPCHAPLHLLIAQETDLWQQLVFHCRKLSSASHLRQHVSSRHTQCNTCLFDAGCCGCQLQSKCTHASCTLLQAGVWGD